jgi:SNF2 family DNA or RNA helicase
MPCRIEEANVIVSETGVSMLRLQQRFSSRIGRERIQNRRGEGFSFPLASLGRVYDLVESLEPDTTLRVRIEKFNDHACARLDALATLQIEPHNLPDEWSAHLDPHQVSAVACMTTPGLLGVCLFDEQGSGKTVMAIAAFDILFSRGDVSRLIVLCPKTMIEEWRKDIATFTRNKYRVAAVGDVTTPGVPAGFENCDIYITNYEALGNVGWRLEATANGAKTLMTVDESFFAKNPDAKRTELAVRLRASCTMAYVLCGTPAPNSYADIVTQSDLADLGFAFGGSVPLSLEEAQATLEERGTVVRRLKHDVFPTLAGKTHFPVSVPLAPMQRVLYQKAVESIRLHLRNLDNSAVIRRTDSYFQKRAALLQICSWPESIDPSYTETPSKVVALDDLLSQIIELQGRKAVLWSFYRDSIAALSLRYSKYHPVVITGGTPQVDRRRAISAFQTNPDTKLFIGSPGAAGAGITLTAASDAIYFSLSNNAADFLQSVDRIHRRGQNAKNVSIHVLLASGTIEEKEYARLLSKEKAQSELLSDREDSKITVADALLELSELGAS